MARLDGTLAERSELAATSGAAEAFFALGLMYCNGREVDPDLVVAHKWFNLAAMRGSREARDYRIEISREMTCDQIAEAQRLARDWLAAIH